MLSIRSTSVDKRIHTHSYFVKARVTTELQQQIWNKVVLTCLESLGKDLFSEGSLTSIRMSCNSEAVESIWLQTIHSVLLDIGSQSQFFSFHSRYVESDCVADYIEGMERLFPRQHDPPGVHWFRNEFRRLSRNSLLRDHSNCLWERSIAFGIFRLDLDEIGFIRCQSRQGRHLLVSFHFLLKDPNRNIKNKVFAKLSKQDFKFILNI